MFKTTITTISSSIALFSALVSTVSFADIELGEIIDIPGESSELSEFEFPIADHAREVYTIDENIVIEAIHPSCPAHISGNTALSNRVKRSLIAIERQVKCGQLSQALREVTVLQRTIRSQIAGGGGVSQTERGFCYEDKNCSGDLVVKTIVEKGACDAAGGKSWKRTNPTSGNCRNL